MPINLVLADGLIKSLSCMKFLNFIKKIYIKSKVIKTVKL